MKKLAYILILSSIMTSFVSCGVESKKDKNETNSIEISNSFTSEEEKFDYMNLSKEEKQEYIDTYIMMNPITVVSWNDPNEVETVRFGTFYANNAPDIDKYYTGVGMEYAIPRDVYEGFIQKYFKVSSEHLRTDSFYNSEKEIYTGFLPGLDRDMNYNITEIKRDGNLEEITYEAVLKMPESEEEKIPNIVKLGIEHESDDSFKFIYVELL